MTKKKEVVERSVNEKRFCKKCEYYYSEFFSCPICYGEKRAEQRIIKAFLETAVETKWGPITKLATLCNCDGACIDQEEFIALIKAENK